MSADRRPFHLRATSHRGGAGLDAASMFALVAVAPFLLPALGVELGDVVFAVPFVLLAYAANRCASAARTRGADRFLWIALGAACALASASSALAIVGGAAGFGRQPAFYTAASA